MYQTFLKIAQNPYYLKSILFYILIIGLSSGFAFLSQANISKIDLKRSSSQKIWETMQKIFLGLSFFVLWFFSAFASCGADRESYRIIFQNVSVKTIFDGWQEPGFNLFNLIFRFWGDNPTIIFVAMTTVTLLLVYSTLEYFKDEIHVGFAILAYGSLFYVQSLSLMRIYLASAILFWGFRYLKREEYLKYCIVLLTAILIHYSCCIMIFPFLVLFIMYNHRYLQSVHIIITVCLMVGSLVAVKILAPVLGVVPMFSRFQQYFQNLQAGGFGVVQIIYFAPICALVAIIYKELDVTYRRIFLTYTSSAFFIAMMSYIIIILGRAFVLFSIVYLFFIPYAMNILKKKWKKIPYRLLCIGVVIYYFVRFIIYLSEYYKLDQIIPYTNVLF